MGYNGRANALGSGSVLPLLAFVPPIIVDALKKHGEECQGEPLPAHYLVHGASWRVH